jgi:hypothetical protein
MTAKNDTENTKDSNAVNVESTALFHISDDEYRGEDGTTLKREYGETPNGNPLNGRWVLRGPDGERIDFDQYRHDLASRYRLNLLNTSVNPAP